MMIVMLMRELSWMPKHELRNCSSYLAMAQEGEEQRRMACHANKIFAVDTSEKRGVDWFGEHWLVHFLSFPAVQEGCNYL